MARTYSMTDLEKIQAQFEELLFVAETAVILVDKQVSLRKTIARMLEDLGVEKDRIFEAEDDLKAWPIIEKNTDKKLVIITELNFARPQCDGVKFIGKLNSNQATENASILILSDERKKERLVAALKLKVAGYFKKPLDAAALKEKLIELKVSC